MAMYNPYDRLLTLYSEEKALTDQERLASACGPLLSWYDKNRRKLPWRETKNAYSIWVSEIMLQQTRVEAVKPYYFRFMERFPTVESLADAPEEELLKRWEGLGYYSRARNLKKAAVIIAKQYGGKLPASYEALRTLPGIGSYTAGAIASIAYGLPAPAVDGNVLRVLSRVTGSREDILKASVKRKMEKLIEEFLKESVKGRAGDFNQALIETGAVICIPNGVPLCGECPFRTVCEAEKKGLIGEIPVKSPKKKRKIEEKTVLLLKYEDKIAIRKRPEEGLLASLYEFPSLPGYHEAREIRHMLSEAGDIASAPEAKHIFSHTEWHMKGYLVAMKEPKACLQDSAFGDIVFVEYREISKKYPIPSAFAAYREFLKEQCEGTEIGLGG